MRFEIEQGKINKKISKKSSSGDARGQLERNHGLARGATWILVLKSA